jgi:hypothetical protein
MSQRAVGLTYDQRCALRWAIEEALVINDPDSVPTDWNRNQKGILLRQARHALRAVDAEETFVLSQLTIRQEDRS